MSVIHNRTTRVKRGETGHLVVITFYDDDGVTPYDLTGYTAILEVTAPGSPTNLLESGDEIITGEMTINDDPETGIATYQMTADDALLPAGTYDWEARAIHTDSGLVRIAPKVDGDLFGVFKILESKIEA